MYRKRIILILTSRDEPDGVSERLAEAIRKIGTHNVVVMSDDKYGSATKLSALDKIMDSGGEYQYLLERKDKGVPVGESVQRDLAAVRDKLGLTEYVFPFEMQ